MILKLLPVEEDGEVGCTRHHDFKKCYKKKENDIKIPPVEEDGEVGYARHNDYKYYEKKERK